MLFFLAGRTPLMAWSRWANWPRNHPHWRCRHIDMTPLSLPPAAEQALVAGGYRLALAA